MKRTGEIILTSIGLALNFLGTLVVAFFLIFSNTDFVRDLFEEGFMEGAMEEGVSANPGDAQTVINLLLGVGWIVFAGLLISTILGALAVYFFVGNKKSTTASILVIVAAILIAIGTAFAGFVPAVLYLIAGIMGLVRKPPIKHDPNVAETNLHWEQNNPDEFN